MKLRKSVALLLVLAPVFFWTATLLAGDNVTTGGNPTATGDARAGEQINWQVIPAGSAHATSMNYEMFATAAQSTVGTISSRGYTIKQGFWKGGSAVAAEYVCGDADGNEIVNISDAVYLITYIFGGGPPPDPLLAGDCDCNEIVNISDAVYLIAYIFGGGPEPCAACP